MPLYNNPALGQAFGNLAKIFAPPSGSELAGYATAAAKRQEAQRLAELYSYATAPNFDQSTFDRLGQATGQWTPSTGYYGVDVSAATSRSNNAADNARALDQTRLEQEGALAKLFATPITVGEGQTTYLPQQTQTATGLGPTLGGAIKLNPGEQATLPGGATLSGAPKPLTEAEVQGGILAGLPQADQRAKVLGDIPVETIIMGGRPQGVRRNDASSSVSRAASMAARWLRSPRPRSRNTRKATSPCPVASATLISTTSRNSKWRWPAAMSARSCWSPCKARVA